MQITLAARKRHFPTVPDEVTLQEPIGSALATALTNSDLSFDALVAADFNPSAVAQCIRAKLPSNIGLDDLQRSLLNRAIERSAEAIIDASGAFESFAASSIIEILLRLIDLQNEIKLSLNKLSDAVLATQSQGERAAADYEIHHRRQVERALNHLEILGVESETFRCSRSGCPKFCSIITCRPHHQ